MVKVSSRGLLCASLAVTLLLGGCSWIGSLFEKKKDPPLPGERISVLQGERKPPSISGTQGPVLLPRPENNLEWPQAGGYPNHDMQHPALSEGPAKLWQASIGDGSSSCQHVMSMPVVAAGRIYAIDASGEVSCLDAGTGRKVWSVDSKPEDASAPVVSGGVAFAEGRLFVATGLAQVMALDPATGKQIWVQRWPAPVHAAPTVPTAASLSSRVDNELIALAPRSTAASCGRRAASPTPASLRAAPAPPPKAASSSRPTARARSSRCAPRPDASLWEDNLPRSRRVDAVSAPVRHTRPAGARSRHASMPQP